MTGAEGPVAHRTLRSPGPHRHARRATPFIVVLAVALAWALAATPPALAQSTASVPPVPTVTVFASWEGGGPASWSAYTAVVKNIGDVAFSGRLDIGPAEVDETAAGGTAPGAHGGQGPEGPARGRVIGAAHHRSPLSLDPGEERRVSALLVVSPVAYRAEVRSHDGRLMARTEPKELAADTGETVALLSDSAPGRGFLLTGARPTVTRTERFRSAGDFPSSAGFLRGLGAVVIADFDSATLSPDQLDALRGFLHLGGSLVVAGGAAWERTVRPLPEDLTPLRPSATAIASLTPMAELAASPGDARVTVSTGDIVGGRTVLEGVERIPLMVEKDYGAGRIVQLAFDPLADLAAPASRTLAMLARDYALARAGVGASDRPAQASAPSTGRDAFLAILDAPKREPVPLAPLALILVLYSLLVGPAAYLGGRRRSHTRALWSVAPALAVGLATLTWVASFPLQPGAVDHQLQVQRQGSGGTLLVDSWHRLLPPRSGDTEVALGPDVLAWVEPWPADRPMRLPPLVGPLVAGQPVGGDDGSSTLREDGPTQLDFGRWPVWGGRTVRTSSVVRQPPILEGELRFEDGLVLGRVNNRSDAPVHRLQVHAPDGGRADVAATLEPGQSIEVRLRLGSPPPTAPAAPGSASALADLVANRLVARPGELDLVGLVPARPVLQVGDSSPRTRAEAVLVTTVRLQAADTVAAGLGVPRLVCACGDRGPLVYEVQLPPGPAGPVDVRAVPAVEVPPGGAVEVFHWPSGAWRTRPGALGLSGSARLEAGDFDRGLVRLRVRAPDAVSALRVVSAAGT